jgi:hypothetical protein
MSSVATATDAHATAQAWVEGFTQGWRSPRGPDAFAAHFLPMLAADIRLIQPHLPTVVGHRAFEQQFVGPLFQLLPDIHGEVERWGARDDTLYIEMTLRATLGGRQVSWRVCDRVTLQGGLAVERESYFDPSPILIAVAKAPRAWPRFMRLQLQSAIAKLTRRRRP